MDSRVWEVDEWKDLADSAESIALNSAADKWKTLYFTSRSHLGAVNLNVAGIPVPVSSRKA